jgi:threonine dehydrogenase-like Zn-dependent dehydrogenase
VRAVCFDGVQRVALREIPDPQIESSADAIVQVEMAGLCGSDLHVYHGRETGLDVGTVMGHEFVGRVIAIGDDVRSIQVGDRVCAPFSSNCGNCFYCQRGLTSRCHGGSHWFA